MLISIIAPCRNEVGYIDAFLKAVLAQKCPNFEIEIIVTDGCSDDGTREKLAEWLVREPRLKILDNPGQIVSTGLNLAIREASGDLVVRMDIHTTYAPDYLIECLRAIQETGATCVGGPWVAKGLLPKQQAIAAAFQSRIGSGGAASRRADFSGWVDTVYLGAWRRDDLLRLGGFDEGLVRNQDDELALRIIRQGGRIWQSNRIRSEYKPRASLMALYRQFNQYGYWKIPVIRKHRLPASARHIAPFAFLSWIFFLAFLAPLFFFAFVVLCGTLILYFCALIFGTSAQRAALTADSPGWITVAAVSIMHFGYAIGFGRAVLDYLILGKKVPQTMLQLTR